MTFFAFAKGRKEPPAPDPGQYNIPSTFGQAPRYSIGSRHKEFGRDLTPDYYETPSTLSKKGFSIGPSYKKNYRQRSKSAISAQSNDSDKKYSDTPGPYYVQSMTDFGKEGTKISIHQRHFERKDDVPGPGSYNVKMSQMSGPAYSCGVGPRFDFVQNSTPVGPGSYKIPSTLNLSRPLTIGTHARQKFKKKSHPGPIYDTNVPIGKNSPSYSFPKGPRDLPPKEGPGPADYQQVESGISGSNKHQIPPKLKSRTSLLQPDRVSVNVPYYNIQTTIVPRKKSIGNRPPTSYETISPGPVYNLPPMAINDKKEAHIHIKADIPDHALQTPAPGSYWIADPTPEPPRICGLMGPSDESRAPINIKEEKSKPGPADYDNYIKEKSNKGHKISNKYLDDTRPDTAAPYHSASSTLGGPMFTIGLRDV